MKNKRVHALAALAVLGCALALGSELRGAYSVQELAGDPCAGPVAVVPKEYLPPEPISRGVSLKAGSGVPWTHLRGSGSTTHTHDFGTPAV